MKRILIIALALAIMAASWALGRAAGIRHAVIDSAVWADEQGVFLELDGQVHQYD